LRVEESRLRRISTPKSARSPVPPFVVRRRSCSTAPRPGRLGYSNTNSLQQRLACAIPPGRQPARPTLSITNETRRQRARRDLPYTIRDARRDSLLATNIRDHPTSTLSILPAAVARMAACRLKSSFPIWFKRAQSITEIFTSERSCAAGYSA